MKLYYVKNGEIKETPELPGVTSFDGNYTSDIQLAEKWQRDGVEVDGPSYWEQRMKEKLK